MEGNEIIDRKIILEVLKAVRGIKNVKAAGENRIVVDFLKALLRR